MRGRSLTSLERLSTDICSASHANDEGRLDQADVKASSSASSFAPPPSMCRLSARGEASARPHGHAMRTMISSATRRASLRPAAAGAGKYVSPAALEIGKSPPTLYLDRQTLFEPTFERSPRQPRRVATRSRPRPQRFGPCQIESRVPESSTRGGVRDRETITAWTEIQRRVRGCDQIGSQRAWSEAV